MAFIPATIPQAIPAAGRGKHFVAGNHQSSGSDTGDVGSWSSLWDACDKDAHENVSIGEVLLLETHGSYLYSSGKMIAAVGLENIIVVETADAVLVAARDQSQRVRDVANQLESKNCLRTVTHRKVYRPWGN